MKNAILAVCALLPLTALAQPDQISESISGQGLTSIQINVEYANVTIERTSGSDVLVAGEVEINGGENNNAFVLLLDKQGSTAVVSSDIPGYADLPGVIMGVKGDTKTLLGKSEKHGWSSWNKWEKWRKENNRSESADAFDYVREGADVEAHLVISIPEDLSVELRSTYGSVVINDVANPLYVKNTYGSIDAVLPKAKQNVDLFSVYSTVDVTLPQQSKADFNLKTNYGEIYTDLDLDIDHSASTMEAFHNHISASLNGGGPDINLKATYSNVYVRKG